MQNVFIYVVNVLYNSGGSIQAGLDSLCFGQINDLRVNEEMFNFQGIYAFSRGIEIGKDLEIMN